VISLLYKGGPVMAPLMICSIISLAIIMERAVFWIRMVMRRNAHILNVILRLVEKGKLNEAIRSCKASKDTIAKILLEGIKSHDYNFVSALEAAGSNEVNIMKKYMVVLDTIITVAPLLGIFGTVTGIIVSFGILGGGGRIDPGAVTGGIAQALITTASGLVIAIITLIPFNYYNSLIESNAQEIEKYVNALKRAQWKYKRGGKNENKDEDEEG